MTPDDFKAILALTKPGDTVTLEGEFTGSFRPKAALLNGRVLDARKAVFRGVLYPAGNVGGLVVQGGAWGSMQFDGPAGLIIDGAMFAGPDAADGFGLQVKTGKSIAVKNCQFESFKTGIVLNRVDGFDVKGSAFARMRSDGMTIGESRNGLVEDNRFHGTRITGEEHPDFIQIFSRPTSTPTADIAIRGNKGIGMSQGICGFNHVRDGVNDGGFDRITIENNDLCCGFPHAIALVEARDSQVANNRVETYPGARYRASINVEKSPGIVLHGNAVAAGAGKAAQAGI